MTEVSKLLVCHRHTRSTRGARAAYEHREQIAAELLARRGIDPTSAEYRAAALAARNILDQIDQLGSGHVA